MSTLDEQVQHARGRALKAIRDALRATVGYCDLVREQAEHRLGVPPGDDAVLSDGAYLRAVDAYVSLDNAMRAAQGGPERCPVTVEVEVQADAQAVLATIGDEPPPPVPDVPRAVGRAGHPGPVPAQGPVPGPAPQRPPAPGNGPADGRPEGAGFTRAGAPAPGPGRVEVSPVRGLPHPTRSHLPGIPGGWAPEGATSSRAGAPAPPHRLGA